MQWHLFYDASCVYTPDSPFPVSALCGSHTFRIILVALAYWVAICAIQILCRICCTAPPNGGNRV